MLRSILGVLSRSMPRIWRLTAQAKIEYMMNDFSMLTIREPWLLKRISMSMASVWLAEKELILQGRRDWRRNAKSIELSKRALWGKGRLIKEFPYFLYKRWLQVGTSKKNLARTFTYFANLGFWQLVVLKVPYFSKLMQCIRLCSMVLMMHVRMTRLPICVSDCKGNQSRERICVTSCYLTTKIPSALLVAVGSLQHTRYPRFRRGTFDYGATTSPNKRGRVRVRSFMRMHVRIPMLPKCTCYAAHAQSHISI
jgi:hypothetical protein